MEVMTIPPASKVFRLVMVSNHTPIGTRKISWGSAYDPTTTPTMGRLAPSDWAYTGRIGT